MSDEGCCVCGCAVMPDDQPRWGVFHGGYILTAHERCWNPDLTESEQIHFLDARWSEADARAQGRLPLPPRRADDPSAFLHLPMNGPEGGP